MTEEIEYLLVLARNVVSLKTAEDFRPFGQLSVAELLARVKAANPTRRSSTGKTVGVRVATSAACFSNARLDELDGDLRDVLEGEIRSTLLDGSCMATEERALAVALVVHHAMRGGLKFLFHFHVPPARLKALPAGAHVDCDEMLVGLLVAVALVPSLTDTQLTILRSMQSRSES